MKVHLVFVWTASTVQNKSKNMKSLTESFVYNQREFLIPLVLLKFSVFFWHGRLFDGTTMTLVKALLTLFQFVSLTSREQKLWV